MKINVTIYYKLVKITLSFVHGYFNESLQLPRNKVNAEN